MKFIFREIIDNCGNRVIIREGKVSGSEEFQNEYNKPDLERIGLMLELFYYQLRHKISNIKYLNISCL